MSQATADTVIVLKDRTLLRFEKGDTAIISLAEMHRDPQVAVQCICCFKCPFMLTTAESSTVRVVYKRLAMRARHLIIMLST